MSWLDTVAKILGVVGLIVSLGGLVYAWWMSRARKAETRIDSNQQNIQSNRQLIDMLTQRVAINEAEIKHLPNRDDLNIIHDRITNLYGALQEIGGTVRNMDKTVGTINQHLLDND